MKKSEVGTSADRIPIPTELRQWTSYSPIAFGLTILGRKRRLFLLFFSTIAGVRTFSCIPADVDVPTVAGIPAVARLSSAVYVCVFPIVFAAVH